MPKRKREARATVVVELANGRLIAEQSSPQSVIDAAFSLTTSLFVQSSNGALWTVPQLQLFADERRETMTLLQRAEAPQSRLRDAAASELKMAASQLADAATGIREAQSSADLGTAIPLVNSAQAALSALG